MWRNARTRALRPGRRGPGAADGLRPRTAALVTPVSDPAHQLRFRPRRSRSPGLCLPGEVVDEAGVEEVGEVRKLLDLLERQHVLRICLRLPDLGRAETPDRKSTRLN